MPETRHTSNYACYGVGDNTTVSPSCDAGSVIAIDRVIVGAHKTSKSCPIAWSGPSSGDISCCSPSADITEDCTFDLDTSILTVYHEACNGLTDCSRGVQFDETASQCDTSVYSSTTIYMYIEYFCVESVYISIFLLFVISY